MFALACAAVLFTYCSAYFVYITLSDHSVVGTVFGLLFLPLTIVFGVGALKLFHFVFTAADEEFQ